MAHEKYPRDVGIRRSKGALCVLWHSEDVLIYLSGELSAKFLNNNGGELVEERERERKMERDERREEAARFCYQPQLGYA